MTGACVDHPETDGIEHYLHVTEKRGKKRRKILLDAVRPVLAHVSHGGIGEDKEGPLFRPMKPDGTGLVRRHLDRKTPGGWSRSTATAANSRANSVASFARPTVPRSFPSRPR